MITDEQVEAFIRTSSTASGDTNACVRAGLTAALTLPSAGEPFQARVQPWMMACFGPEISGDKLERGDRLIEEVFELLQSGDYPRERIRALEEYTYSRPKGEPRQEVGGVMVTLAAYCLAHDLDMHEAGETELARIWTKVEKIRAKQAAKPVGSALPVAAPSPSASEAQVKPLEWSQFTGRIGAYTPFGGSYAITEYAGMKQAFALEKRGFSGSLTQYFETLEDAKAAAQSDYERRILSALSTPEQGETVPSPETHLVGSIDAALAEIEKWDVGIVGRQFSVFRKEGGTCTEQRNHEKLEDCFADLKRRSMEAALRASLETPSPETHVVVSDEAVMAACRAHTPQFDRLDADIARYAKEQMRDALTAALKVMEISR